MDCQAESLTERAAQRIKARQQTTDAERKRAHKQLEDDTKTRFEAIQKEAAKGK
jgi:hypothetical protein